MIQVASAFAAPNKTSLFFHLNSALQQMQHHDKENQLTLDDIHSPLIHSITPHSNKHNLFKPSKHSLLTSRPTTSALMGRPKQGMLHDITNSSNGKTPVLRYSSKLSQVTVSIEDLGRSNGVEQTLDDLGEIENAHIVEEGQLDGVSSQWHYDEELRHLVEVAKQNHFHKIEGLEYLEVEGNRLPALLVDEPDFVTEGIVRPPLLPFQEKH